jgi:putative ABC transport system permease protein
VSADVRLVVGLLALLSLAVGALSVAGVPQRRAVVTAAARAAVQLAFVAAVLRGALEQPIAVVAVVAVMFSVANWTAGRRLAMLDRALQRVVLSCAAGSFVTIAVVVALPTLTRDVRTLVAISGIVFGNSMTAATLTGRRLLDGLRSRRDEVEAWLAIGATPRQAVRDVARMAVREALVPALDQTRTVGLVTLPGAFVGALLGGASAADAARFQLVVLVGVLCAQSITATVLAWLLGAPATLPNLEGEPSHT